MPWDETFDVGVDTRTGVDDADYQVPFRFHRHDRQVDGRAQAAGVNRNTAIGMKSQQTLLLVMTILELGAGLGLLLVPGLALRVLLGTEQPAIETVAVTRLAGVALIAIGVLCHQGWRGKDHRSVLPGILVYNAGASAVLAYVGAGLGLSGPILWPAVVLHAALALWTIFAMPNAAI